MFRFHLVKDRPFQLHSASMMYAVRPEVVCRRIFSNLPVEIQSEENGETKELSELRKQMAMEGYSELEWNLHAEIGINHRPSMNPGDLIAVWEIDGNRNILDRVKEVLEARGFELKMRVEIKNFGGHQGDKINLWTSEEGIVKIPGSMGPVGFRSDHLQFSGELDRDLWRSCGVRFTGLITITCIAYPRVSLLPPKAVLSFPGSGSMSTRILQKMLDEGLNSDATIITAEGEEIKCHKFILTGYSDVFEAMFKEASKSAESVTGTIQMDDMCSKSVKALLAYLYSEDIEKAEGDSDVALDLFQAAHNYDLPILEGKMKHLLSSKPDEWFNVEVAMQLYFFVKNLEDAEELRKKALLFMKKNYSALNEMPAYIQLFDEEPQSARQLCGDLISFK